MKQYKRVLSIAGSDSGGGAGIQADIKAISACGSYAMTAITAITVQNTVGVSGVHIVPTETVRGQIRAVLTDIGVDAVKVGMLPNEEIIVAVAEILQEFQVQNIVIDPVMVATSGDRLISEAAAEAIKTYLFPIATLVTPNIPEASYITGIEIRSEADFPTAAEKFAALETKAVLLKAGHLDGIQLTDILYNLKQGREEAYTHPRIDTRNTHGTGCTLSSAIAAYLSQGHPLDDAVARAENYLHQAILQGKEFALGKGHGPVHHFFNFWNR